MTDKEIAVKQIMESLEAARVEALALSAEVEWVVCFDRDMTPFRIADDGRVQIAGKKIWRGNRRQAQALAKALNIKAEESAKAHNVEPTAIYAMPCTSWATKRNEVLKKLVAQLQAVNHG